jgi:hypothetical protein
MNRNTYEDTYNNSGNGLRVLVDGVCNAMFSTAYHLDHTGCTVPATMKLWGQGGIRTP